MVVIWECEITPSSPPGLLGDDGLVVFPLDHHKVLQLQHPVPANNNLPDHTIQD